MKPAKWIALAVAIVIAVSIAGQAQTKSDPIATGNKAPQDKPPVEIVSHKIGMEYYPMLDRPDAMSAENGDMPMTENERLARQRNRNTRPVIQTDEKRSRGRLRSYTR